MYANYCVYLKDTGVQVGIEEFKNYDMESILVSRIVIDYSEFIVNDTSLADAYKLAYILDDWGECMTAEIIEEICSNKMYNNIYEIANLFLQDEDIPYFGYEYGRPYDSKYEKYGKERIYTCYYDLSSALDSYGLEGYFDFEEFGHSCDDDVTVMEDGYIDYEGDIPSSTYYTHEELDAMAARNGCVLHNNEYDAEVSSGIEQLFGWS